MTGDIMYTLLACLQTLSVVYFVCALGGLFYLCLCSIIDSAGMVWYFVNYQLILFTHYYSSNPVWALQLVVILVGPKCLVVYWCIETNSSAWLGQ